MPIDRLPSGLPAQLRTLGADVIELPGWHQRGRPASTGRFRPVGVLWHHTGGSPDTRDYVDWMTLTGRSDLPAPLCQLSIDRKGRIYFCAGGRANHAGKARSSGTVAAGDGNELYVGVECLNTGDEGWTPKQYAAMVLLGAVLMTVLGTSAQAQRGHRETSVTGKWDPGLLDLDDFRTDIAAKHRQLVAPPKPDPEPEYPLAERLLTDVDTLRRRLKRAAEKGAPVVRGITREHRDDLDPLLADLRRELRRLVGDS